MRKLLDASSSERSVDLDEVWQQIEQVVPRWELRAAVATVQELVPFDDDDDEGEIRKRLAERIRLVSGFLRELTEVIEFGATPEGAPVLDEMRRLPALLGRRRLKTEDISDRLVRGSWRRVVYGQPGPADGTVDRNAYAFCVLTQFHRQLMRREIYAPGSSRWRDPRAQLLAGEAWANAEEPALMALSLPENPDRLLDRHARTLDAAYREVAQRLGPDTKVTVDDQGKLHVNALKAIPEPATLVELRKLLEAMVPRVSVPEVILEVMSWHSPCPGHPTVRSKPDSNLPSMIFMPRRATPRRAAPDCRLTSKEQWLKWPGHLCHLVVSDPLNGRRGDARTQAAPSKRESRSRSRRRCRWLRPSQAVRRRSPARSSWPGRGARSRSRRGSNSASRG